MSPKRTVYGSLTTPDPIALHRQLDEIATDGVTHLAFEASSHGLDQFRLDGVRVAAGGFTNLSRDHMDYHPDVAHYFNAKLRLFRDLVMPDGAAVISADHDCSGQVAEAAYARGLRIIAVGREADGAGEGIRLLQASIEGFAQKLVLEHRGRHFAVRLPLVGEFQIENALVAAGLAIGTGSAAEAVFASLEQLEGAKGRLEHVGEHNGAPIFVDYAHKPDALAKALQALRPYARRKLVVDLRRRWRPRRRQAPADGRDRGRECRWRHRHRRQSAQRKSGHDPRRDPGGGEGRQRDRRPCGGDPGGIAALQPGDALLIAGKGHETDQIVGDRNLPFDDHQAVAERACGRMASALPGGPAEDVARGHPTRHCGRVTGLRRAISPSRQPRAGAGRPVRGADRHAERRLHFEFRQRARRLGIRRQGGKRPVRSR